jgi:hypothetical protein
MKIPRIISGRKYGPIDMRRVSAQEESVLNLYSSEGGPLIGKFGGYFSGSEGCNIACLLTYTMPIGI